MKKFYLLLLFLLFTVLGLRGQTTETFESAANGASFTSNSKTFNLSSPSGFTVVNIGGFGYNFSNRYIQAADVGNTYGQTGTISTTGNFKLNSLWIYLTGNSAQDPGVTVNGAAGSVTFRGKLGGSTVFTVIKNTTGADTGFGAPGNGFILINFATEGGSNNTTVDIDQLEIQLSSNYDYFAVDNFTWTANTSPSITTTGTFSNFTACPGTPSAQQMFTASGSNLTGNITVTAPANYELATVSGGPFTTTPLTLTPTSGTVNSTNIYARLTSSASTNTGASISLTSSGATTKTLSVTGIVTTISGTTVVTNIACNGGTTGAINLTPTGGSGPYTFSWATGQTTEDRTGLAAGSYSVTITDTASGCTGTVSGITVTQPPAITMNANSQTNVSCNGGSTGAASVNAASGGAGGYTYDWTPGNPTGDGTTNVTGLTAGTWTCTVTDANGCTKAQNFTVTQPPTLNGSGTVTNVACNSGTTGAIDLTPSGGTPGYTYNWGGGITTQDRTNLAAGSYSVTITDANGCTRTVPFTVTQPTAVSGTTVVTNVACRNGTTGAINLTPTGGTGPYTFNWASGPTTEDRTGLTAGTYSVTITDANGCTGTVNATVTQPAAVVSGTTVVTNVACNGGNTGAINLTPTGGVGPYTFNWVSGPTTEDRTGLVAGAYSVTITDANGCTGTVNATVTQPTTVSGIATVTNVACNGGTTGSIDLTPTGGTPGYTYNWGGGITSQDRTNLAAGSYSVTITDANGCTGTIPFTITQPTAVSGTTVVTNVACFGGNTGAINLTPTGGTGPYTFDWASGPTSEDRTNLTAGTYSVTITDANGCTGTVNATVTQPAAVVSGTTVVSNVSCFNGSNGTINLTPTGGVGPYTFNWASGPTTEDRTGLTPGTYSVTITDANGCSGTVSGITVTQPAAAVSGTTVVTNVACFGQNNGAINFTPTGGTGPYTYNWGGGITSEDRTGLVQGTYSVTITDANGCTGTVSATVTQPASSVSGMTIVTNVACNGQNTGVINLTPVGGTSPYTFNWGGGITSEDRTALTAGSYSVTITDANGCTGVVNTTVTQAPLLSGTTVVTNVACNGGNTGAINLTPTGGIGPYTFDWGGGVTSEDRTGLTAGTYSVTITDDYGCTKTISGITITQPTGVVSGTTVVTNVSCNGGTNGAINLTPTGGTGPYTYNWVSGPTTEDRTGLSPGTYSVTITDANGCSGTVSGITVTQPSAPVGGTTVVTNVSCNGGTNGAINLTPSGGTGPYTYNWGGGITTEDRTGLSPGTYSVTITDANACSATVSGITITQTTAITMTPSSQTNVACNGGATGAASVNAATGGAGGFTYDWTPGTPTGDGTTSVTGLAAGTWTCTVTDANGCTKTQSFTVTQPAAIVSGTTVVTNVACFGGNTGAINLTPTGGTGPYTYNWVSGPTTEDRTGLTAGTYSVTITDANGCTGTVNATITQPPASVSGTTVVTNVSCFNGSNGTINLTPIGGVGPYTYNWLSGPTTEDRTGLTPGTYSVTITDANGCMATLSGITVTQPAAAVSGTTVVTNVSCNGGANGAINLTPTGGTGPYTYNWGGGITTEDRTGLLAGAYSVTITDANGCTGTVNGITVTQPPILNATAAAQTNIACNGGSTGSATVNVTGGTGSYTYSWAPTGGTAATANGLVAGTYTVTVADANGCTDTQSFTITQPTALATSTGIVNNVSCNGGANGTAQVIASGGTPGYTYSWAPSGGTFATATGLSAGTYTVTVTDANGCEATRSFTINQPTALVASFGSQTNTSCNGGANGSATVAVTGGTPNYTYSWAPTGGTAATASGLVAGTYTVTVADANNCMTTQSFTITQPPLLTSTISKTDVLCNGGSTGTATVTPSGGSTPYTYVWKNSGNTVVGTSATATGLPVGNYTCQITDNNGCNITPSITIFQPSVLAATTSQINATCTGSGQGSVIASGGVTPYSYLWSTGAITATTNLPEGNHTCTITDANGCTITKNFTIGTTNTLVATTSYTDVLCNGANTGSATVTPSGAPGPYTYAWAPSGGNAATASNLAAGNYSVTITASNGCSIVKNFTINQPSALVATAGTQTNVSCNGGANGTATVNVTGGTPGYTYLWAPSGGTFATAIGLAAGTYTVTVKDANLCQTTQSFTITQPAALVATAGAQTNVSCNSGTNGSATVAVVGGTGTYTYVWAPTGGTGATASGLAAGTYTVTVKDANLCQTTQSFTITEPTVLTATTSQTNILCNGGATGSATVTPVGGTAAYTYSWAPSGGTAATASGLVAGTYTCTITDANGCFITKTVTLTQPATLVATAGTQFNVSCNSGANGSATVNVTGGTGAYTYLWAPSGGTLATATGLSAGTYTVTVKDANLCQTTQSFTITQPTALSATTSQTNVSCFGASNGTASVVVTGGTGAYTYSWAPSGGTAATATGLAVGTYTVTINDANLCQITRTFTITSTQALSVTASQTNVSCNGNNNGSATVAVTGGTGTYTYSWAPSGGTAATATGLAPGTYTVTATDGNGCTISNSFTITQPAVLAATTSQTNVLCNAGTTGSATVTVSGGTAGYTYAWSPSGGTAATATGLAAGNYSVLITDTKGCTLTKTFTITQPTALTATTTQTNILCFGAATGSATVTATGGTTGYTYAWSPSGGTAATATGLAAGNYICTITDANGCIITKNFAITQPAAALAATTTQTNILCFGSSTGSATVTATGGTGAYTYAWSPSGGTAATATGLAAGNYTCTITDANGCTLAKPFTITQQPALVVNGASTNITCNGTANGTATVTVTGGTPGYTYSWSPSGGTGATATGLSGGVYVCTVTDANGCTKTRSFTIYEQPAIVVTSVKTDVVCPGATTGSATVTVTGGVPNYNYSWAPSGGNNPTATGLAAGNYTCTVTDVLGCSVIHNVTITGPAAWNVATTQTDITCFGSNNGAIELNISGATAPYTYAWTPAVGTGASISGLTVGNYSVTITDALGCSTIRNFSLTQPEELTASITTTNVSCYGNNDGTALAEITGGTAPYTHSWTAPGGGTPDPANLVAGTYTVTITDANGCTFTGSITISQPLQTIVSAHPLNVTTDTGANATYTVTAINVTDYQWQYSEDGSSWSDITNGGTNPSYSGATTNSLTITGIPASYNGYSYRVILKNGVDCMIISNSALLTLENVIEAVNDDFSNTEILAGTGGIAGDVSANDLLNGDLVDDNDVVMSIIDNDGLFGVTIDSDGNIIVPSSATTGTYTITYTICEAASLTNCSTAEVTVIVTDVSGTADFRDLKLSIYPNPASTSVFIKIPDFSDYDNLKVSVYDLNGRLVKESRITSELQSIDVMGMESGVYVFKVMSDTAEATKRIVVEKRFE